MALAYPPFEVQLVQAGDGLARSSLERYSRGDRGVPMTRRRPPDQDDVRRIALALPETSESAHRGRPDLRVRNKIFATLPEDGASANLKTTAINLDDLVSFDPATFRDVWGGKWVGSTSAASTPSSCGS